MLFWTLKINQLMNLHGATAAASALSQHALHMQQVRQGQGQLELKSIHPFTYSFAPYSAVITIKDILTDFILSQCGKR